MTIVYLKRNETFSASHRLNSNKLSEEENKKIYSKCNNFHGHGHNYEVTVTLKGSVNETTGMVYNLADLKNEMKIVIDILDHKNIDKDIDYFKDIVSTTENLTIFFWNEMKKIMKNGDLLYEIEIKETNKNIFCYRGE
ncbi:6-pyruvoyl tetrahydrobiopterin synthase [Strongyloides ratti]|uniref:6-pyruvoyltetrahydropterin synthase n=1 Tax=Strongyloides ratti TaxID=34506 RepID=A0A090L973_STRRB|nr:6-pyruvoyl tetrahydrobiopterin synthase [Strongyloides ratti]CEF66287.1 6-pyruvoyl tetrahydrobiopterin synthase [Strongyloides ratti]